MHEPDTIAPPRQAAAVLHRTLLQTGQVDVHYQPIIDLRSGNVLGVELLGRLLDGQRLIYPAAFLPHFNAADRRTLFDLSLAHGVAMLPTCRLRWPDIRLSLNLEPSALLDPGFLAAFLRLAGDDVRSVTLEILESGDILDLHRVRRQLDRLRAHGVRIALDDIGSAYSSLLRLKQLPIDVIKLDQCFIRGLQQAPEDIAFVSSVMALGRGLGRCLVVEGVETPAILDAMRILGVEAAQGFAIARPMKAEMLSRWLATYVAEPKSLLPRTLLGAYASHLCLVDAYRSLLNQPIPTLYMEEAGDPHSCMIGRFLDANGLAETPYGLAHTDFHTILPFYQERPADWEEAAKRLKTAMEVAIRSQNQPVAGRPVAAT
jgi:EAL domain-containing protein (putative c-di-GMP-specific phosphodiesterase class I)